MILHFMKSWKVFLHKIIALKNQDNDDFQEEESIEVQMNSPPEEWIKINVGASRNTTRLPSRGYITRDNQAKIIRTEGSQIGDCSI